MHTCYSRACMTQNLLDDSNIDPSVFQVHRLMAQATLFYHKKLNQILIPFLSVTLPRFRQSGNILNIYLHKLVGYNILRRCLAVVSSWRVSTAIFCFYLLYLSSGHSDVYAYAGIRADHTSSFGPRIASMSLAATALSL